MVRPGRDRLHGHVEVDEVWLGSKVTPGSQHPGITRGKGLIAVAVETMPYRARFGRIRMRRLQGRSAADLIPFVKDSIKPGSVIHTDGHLGYNQLPQHFYFHQRYNQSQAPPSVSPTDILPAVHRVASLLKRWKMGTHHGSMSRKHLDAYLDEFTFRFNRRSSNHRGLLFHRLLQYAVALSPQTYAELTA
jgi:transposase-like protein